MNSSSKANDNVGLGGATASNNSAAAASSSSSSASCLSLNAMAAREQPELATSEADGADGHLPNSIQCAEPLVAVEPIDGQQQQLQQPIRAAYPDDLYYAIFEHCDTSTLAVIQALPLPESAIAEYHLNRRSIMVDTLENELVIESVITQFVYKLTSHLQFRSTNTNKRFAIGNLNILTDMLSGLHGRRTRPSELQLNEMRLLCEAPLADGFGRIGRVRIDMQLNARSTTSPVRCLYGGDRMPLHDYLLRCHGVDKVFVIQPPESLMMRTTCEHSPDDNRLQLMVLWKERQRAGNGGGAVHSVQIRVHGGGFDDLLANWAADNPVRALHIELYTMWFVEDDVRHFGRMRHVRWMELRLGEHIRGLDVLVRGLALMAGLRRLDVTSDTENSDNAATARQTKRARKLVRAMLPNCRLRLFLNAKHLDVFVRTVKKMNSE